MIRPIIIVPDRKVTNGMVWSYTYRAGSVKYKPVSTIFKNQRSFSPEKNRIVSFPGLRSLHARGNGHRHDKSGMMSFFLCHILHASEYTTLSYSSPSLMSAICRSSRSRLSASPRFSVPEARQSLTSLAASRFQSAASPVCPSRAKHSAASR